MHYRPEPIRHVCALPSHVIESDVYPVVCKVQVVIKDFPRGTAAQILHDRLLLSSLPTHILRIVGCLLR